MFDFPTPTPSIQQTAPPRALALNLLAGSGARLRLAASRLGGDAGSALIGALCDMIIDMTVDPLHWPIDEAIALLRQPPARKDAQVDRLIDQLGRIRDRIGQGPDADAA